MLGSLKKALSKRKSTSNADATCGTASQTANTSASVKNAEIRAEGLAPLLANNQISSLPARRPSMSRNHNPRARAVPFLAFNTY